MMKKAVLLLLAVLLLIPTYSSAYTVFIAVDDSVALQNDLRTVVLDDLFPIATSVPLGSSVTFNPGPGEFVMDGIAPPSTLGFNGSVSSIPPISAAGLWFYYTDPTPPPSGTLVPPVLIQALIEVTSPTDIQPTTKYDFDLTQTLEFASFNPGSFTIPDPGAIYTLSEVPIPSAVWLLAPGLIALIGLRRRNARR